MKRILMSLMLAAASLVATAQSPGVTVGQTYTCVPHKVWDGDTFDATCADAGEVRVRLYQADAPERNQPRGGESTRWLNEAVWKQTVNVKIIALESRTATRQARVVGQVTKDLVLLNLKLVQDGRAWAAPGFTKPGDATRLAEASARARKVGLWDGVGAAPISPWSWRHGVRAKPIVTPTPAVKP